MRDLSRVPIRDRLWSVEFAAVVCLGKSCERSISHLAALRVLRESSSRATEAFWPRSGCDFYAPVWRGRREPLLVVDNLGEFSRGGICG